MLLKPQSITRASSQDLAVVVSRHILLINYFFNAQLLVSKFIFRTLGFYENVHEIFVSMKSLERVSLSSL